MIFGIGTDIIEYERVERKILNGSGFKEKVFTANEINYCEKKTNKAEKYAARFAAKEAFLKAIGTGWPNGLQFDEIEIVNDELGKPHIVLYGNALEYSKQKAITNIYISISHLKDIVNAIVVLQANYIEDNIEVYSTYVDVNRFYDEQNK